MRSLKGKGVRLVSWWGRNQSRSQSWAKFKVFTKDGELIHVVEARLGRWGSHRKWRVRLRGWQKPDWSVLILGWWNFPACSRDQRFRGEKRHD